MWSTYVLMFDLSIMHFPMCIEYLGQLEVL
jgi:hypothetical protein